MIDFTKLSRKEQKRIFKEEDKKKPFNKRIVSLIVWMNIIFTIVVAFLFYKTGNEPSALIDKWFKFTGVELVALAGIKVTDNVKDMIKVWKGVKNE